MKEGIPFYKMSGAGNDFVVVDNRGGYISEKEAPGFAIKVCRRGMSVGADGILLIENTDSGSDFKWGFYNSDGSAGEMCGNGARCAARFAHIHGIAGDEMVFDTLAGPIRATVKNNVVSAQLTDPFGLKTDMTVLVNGKTLNLHYINTGVPHVVVFSDENDDFDLDAFDVENVGRKIRYHDVFVPAGANVNFAKVVDNGNLHIRTYERGVETETLACGTGGAASALIGAHIKNMSSPVMVSTRGGVVLTIRFELNNGAFSNVYLEGEARIIYTGKLYKGAFD